MRVNWHRYKLPTDDYEFVLFVGEWEFRVRDIRHYVGRREVAEAFGGKRWYAIGPGLEGGRPTAHGAGFTETLTQAKQRCEDAALRCVEACAKDIGMKVVPA